MSCCRYRGRVASPPAGGRLPRPHRDPEGAPGHLHDADPLSDPPRRHRMWAPTCTARSRELYRRPPRAPAGGSGCSGCRPTAWCPPGPSSWPCSAGERWGDVERAVDRIESPVRAGGGQARLAAGSRPPRPEAAGPRRDAREFPSGLVRRRLPIIGGRFHPRSEATHPHATQRSRTADPRGDRATPGRRGPEARRAGRAHGPLHAPRATDPPRGPRVRRRLPVDLLLFVVSPVDRRPSASS